MAPVIKETVQLLRASIPAMIDINLALTTSSDVVLASPVEIQQILMNLVNNAALAMQEKGGTLELGLHDSSQEQGMLELVVRDTGTGMGPDVMKRIFDPFFTTREVGKGTGMGLPVVYGIVKDLKGAITVKSSPGEGSTFRVLLAKADSSLPSDPIEIPHVSGGSERILFVEDEEMLAEWGRATLERLGYTVNVATDGAEALKLFSSDPHLYDLVITDYAMPRIPGSQLASELIEQRSDIPIILCTGYSETLSSEQAGQLGIRKFLTKPLARYELAVAVREVLDNKEPR